MRVKNFAIGLCLDLLIDESLHSFDAPTQTPLTPPFPQFPLLLLLQLMLLMLLLLIPFKWCVLKWCIFVSGINLYAVTGTSKAVLFGGARIKERVISACC